MHPRILFLTGYMGAGKTTTGELLAGLLDCQFIDLDRKIEEREKCSVNEIFDTRGEHHFREVERQTLESAVSGGEVVIATGGGCAIFNDNMEWMNEKGITIYLRCHPGTLFHRLAPEKMKRPLLKNLTDIELMKHISSQLEIRRSFYEKARLEVNAEFDPKTVAASIIQLLEQ